MVRDRFAELLDKGNIQEETFPDEQKISSTSPGTNLEATNCQNHDIIIEMGYIDDDIGKFLKQIEALRDKIDDVKNKVDKIKYLHGSLLNTPTRNEEKERELDSLMISVKTNTREILVKIKELKEQDSVPSADTTLMRIHKIQYQALLKTFTDLLDYYQAIQTDYQENCKVRVITILKIKNGDSLEDNNGGGLNGEDLDKFLENEGTTLGNISIFTDGLAEETENAKHELTLADARLNDLQKIEISLKELNSLFIEMSQLVVLQGEQIDNIEMNVEKAQDFVQNADEQLKSAKKLQSSARRKRIYIIIIVVIILAVLIGIGVGTYCSKNKC